MTPEIMVVDDLQAMAREAARRVRRSATIALLDRGRWRVSLAGGSTPRPLYRALSDPAATAADPLDWSLTDLFFGDERAVPPDHPDSNYGMVRETLLSRISVPAESVHRMEGEASDLEAAAERYGAALTGRSPPDYGIDNPLDLAILGMGPDGHTASLFPGTTALAERRRPCVAVSVPRLGAMRLTLTYPVFERAREVIFLIAGADKAATLHEILEGPDRPEHFPSQPIIRRSGPVVLFCDRAAAGELSSRVPRSI
jgi:6-phosphogluconolactonase